MRIGTVLALIMGLSIGLIVGSFGYGTELVQHASALSCKNQIFIQLSCN